ncbi:MAG: PspC domain-containing protein [Saprospiraceae bacterium]|nr:PspC domain-containing protein [Saprospiraceae bacterium]
MNKIHTINLGGHPFTVDEDAFEYLQAYIRSLRKHFKNSAGCEEIIGDIESRLAELLTERLDGRTIVTLREVKEVISIMGSPEEFGADPIDETIIDPDRPRKTHKGKKLFKDPDDKIISGVCSGIAAYFGIQDPVWVRLIFSVLIFGGGIGFPVYIILSIILPKATTAADRLAMKGEPIDYNSIAKTVQEEIEHLSNEFNSNLDPETKKQFKASFSTAGKVVSAGSGLLSGLFLLIGNILRNLVPIALKVFAVVALICLSLFIISMIFGWSMLWPYASFFFSGSKATSALSMMNAFFLVLIPMVFVIFMGARMYNGTRLPKSLAAGLGGLWLLNLMGGAFFGLNTARQFSNHAHQDRIVYEGKINSDVLNVQVGDKKDRNDFFKLFGEVWIEDGKVIYPKVPVHISASNDDQFHIRQDLHAAGSSNAEARRRALKIDDVARIDGNTLYVDNYIGIDRQTKIRDQHTSVFIEVPVGKSVRIGEDMYPVDGDKIESNDYPWNMNGLTWVMTKDGLICPEYDAAHPKVIEDAQQSVGDAQDDKDEIKKAVEDAHQAVDEAKDEVKKAVKEVKEAAKEVQKEVKERKVN